MGSLKDYAGQLVPHVWGYEKPDCKHRRQSRDGDLKLLHWAPEPGDIGMCDALLDLGDGVEPVFVMAVQSIDGLTMSTPEGVTFIVKGRPVESELIAATTNTIILTPIIKKNADDEDVA